MKLEVLHTLDDTSLAAIKEVAAAITKIACVIAAFAFLKLVEIVRK